MASLYGYETASPTAGLFSQSSINFALPYFAISLSLNIVLTIMIVAVMLGRKRRGREIFGDTYGKHYTSVSTMFIESAAIYSIISILLLPTYAVQHPIYQIWFGLAPAIQVSYSYFDILGLASQPVPDDCKLPHYLPCYSRACLVYRYLCEDRKPWLNYCFLLWLRQLRNPCQRISPRLK